jgi:hypothetical protein
MNPLIPNGLWFLSSLGDAWVYQQSMHKIASTQKAILMQMLRTNQATQFGREHGFAGIHNISDFQRCIPLRDYDDYIPYITAIAAGEKHILTTEPVTLFEPTSGSTATSKLIPYTRTLKRQFNWAIGAWIVNLFRNYPHLMRGQAYWSVSPLVERDKTTTGGIPIGFEDDTAYLGKASSLISSIMAVPSLVKLITDMDNFRYVSLLFLLRSESLSLISVWNPSFFTILLDSLSQWRERLLGDVQQGSIQPPNPMPEDILAELRRLNTANPIRAKELEEAFALPSQAESYAVIWPHLRLLSAWADAAAKLPAQGLKATFPHTIFQAKGLIATEAFVSFPLVGQAGSSLAINSHFFEFISETGEIFLAHQLERGKGYRIAVTTGGGLWRYQLHDEIEALGGLQIRFLGRSTNIADKFGEKINEGHVEHILETLFETPPAFAILSPEHYPDGTTAYTLFTNQPVSAEKLELLLCENFHYEYCRKLKQLGTARVHILGTNAAERYLRACVALGQRAGDVKATVLYRHGGILPEMLGEE